jgi:vitamin B12 transporter
MEDSLLSTRFPFAASLLASTLVSGTAVGEEPVPLGETVVTASRAEQPLSESLAPTTVIDRSEIEESSSESLQGLLEKRVPGLQMSLNGGHGKSTGLFFRGTNSDHVLVLINGVKQNSATSGTPAVQHLPLDQIERVEVVRGPRSSLYGAEAVGGVIQIFTRKGKAGLHPYAKAGYGTHNTRRYSAGVSGGAGGTTFSVNLSRFATDGIDAQEGGEPDDDGYDNNSASLSLGQELWQGGRAEFSFLRAEGTNEFDGSSVNETDFIQQSAQARFEQTVNAYWDTSLQFGESRDEADNFLNGSRQSFFDTRRLEGTWKNHIFPSRHQEIVLGVDYRLDKVDAAGEDLLGNPWSSSSDFGNDSRENRAGFGRWSWKGERFQTQLGLRYDDNENFGSHTNGDVTLGYRLNKALRLTASYGTAFKAPTFNELYFPGFGNPDLEAETSRSAEIGLLGNAEWGTWEIRTFQTEIDDLIDFRSTPDGFMPINVEEAEIRGLELAAKVRRNGWQVRPSLTFLDPENANTRNQLRRRAEQTFKLDVQRRWANWTLGGDVLAKSERYDDADNTERLGGYGLVNLRAAYRVNDRWQLQVKGNNVLDKEYQTALGYNSLGRTVFASVSYGAI